MTEPIIKTIIRDGKTITLPLRRGVVLREAGVTDSYGKNYIRCIRTGALRAAAILLAVALVACNQPCAPEPVIGQPYTCGKIKEETAAYTKYVVNRDNINCPVRYVTVDNSTGKVIAIWSY